MTNLPSRPSRGGDDAGLPVVAGGKTQFLDIDYNMAALLAYVPFCFFNIIASCVWLKTEPRGNKFLRFHAVQSLIVSAAFFAANMLLVVSTFIMGMIPVVGAIYGMVSTLLMSVCGLAYLGIGIYLMYNAYKGRMTSLPYVGNIADQNS